MHDRTAPASIWSCELLPGTADATGEYPPVSNRLRQACFACSKWATTCGPALARVQSTRAHWPGAGPDAGGLMEIVEQDASANRTEIESIRMAEA